MLAHKRIALLLLALPIVITCGFSSNSPVCTPLHMRGVIPSLERVVHRKRLQTLSSSSSSSEIIEQSAEDVMERVPNTMPKAIQRFFLGPDHGPIAVVGIIAGFVFWRLSISSPLTVLDIFAFSSAVIFWWFQEHFMHQRLLHSDFDWMGKEIHQGHHELPYYHVSIDPAPLMLGWLVVAHLLLRLVLPLDLALAASIGYAGAGLVYEWAHYVAHTRVKPPNAYWKSVRDNHIKHHMVDSRYWFTFSVPAIDSWFGTNPPLEFVKKSAKSSQQTV